MGRQVGTHLFPICWNQMLDSLEKQIEDTFDFGLEIEYKKFLEKVQ